MVLTKRQSSYSIADVDHSCYDQNIRNFSSSSITNVCYSDPEMAGSGSKKKRKGRCSLTYTIFMVLQFATFAVVGFVAYTTRNELNKTASDLSILDADYSALRENLSDTESELQQARNVFSIIKEKMNVIDPRGKWIHNNLFNVEQSKALFETIIKRHGAQSDRIDRLQKSIQQMQLHELEERYGPGPYQVEFAVQVNEVKKFFTVETAPSSLMPHSIYNFMQMAEGGEWDDTILVHGDHIIVATMKDEHFQVKQRKTDTELLFPEYSDEYPHRDQTVGFVGKLGGGPEFYINLGDNSHLHGPGRQAHHSTEYEADPCFAKIIRGVDALREITKDTLAMIENVKILNQNSR